MSAGWEYREIDPGDLPPRTDEIMLLNAAADDGWELVAITKVMPRLLREVRGVVGERKVTIVFDRGG